MVTAGPLVSDDPQVTLFHVECLPQALALDLARPLVALHISLSRVITLRDPHG